MLKVSILEDCVGVHPVHCTEPPDDSQDWEALRKVPIGKVYKEATLPSKGIFPNLS